MKSDSESKEEIDDYQATAASLKMFGRMTRISDSWYPEPLLCKRFNIANPYKKKAKPASEPSREMDPQLHFEEVERAWREHEKVKVKTEPEQPPEIIQTTNDDEILEPERPPVDLFKAIFDDSESEEKSEEVELPDLNCEPTAEQSKLPDQNEIKDSELPQDPVSSTPEAPKPEQALSFISNTFLTKSKMGAMEPPPPKIYGPLAPDSLIEEEPDSTSVGPPKSWYTILNVPSSTTPAKSTPSSSEKETKRKRHKEDDSSSMSDDDKKQKHKRKKKSSDKKKKHRKDKHKKDKHKKHKSDKKKHSSKEKKSKS